MLDQVIRDSYGLHPLQICSSLLGAGSDTYFVTCTEGKYVLKFPADDEMNHPEQEPQLCSFLLECGLPVSRFIKARGGGWFGWDEQGRRCTLQMFLEGSTFPWNTADSELLWEQAELLGRIHAALRNYSGLPEGIGAGFFRNMTPERALLSYQRSLETAQRLGDSRSESELHFRLEYLKTCSGASFDLNALTCGATHGDYNISQLLCDGGHIRAVIDWTSACVHPLIWELVRSYVYAAPECADGVFDARRFQEYLLHYQRFAPLNNYDMECGKALYFYQIAVCDYYGQYYASQAANREIYLQQARLATRLLQREAERGGAYAI